MLETVASPVVTDAAVAAVETVDLVAVAEASNAGIAHPGHRETGAKAATSDKEVVEISRRAIGADKAAIGGLAAEAKPRVLAKGSGVTGNIGPTGHLFMNW